MTGLGEGVDDQEPQLQLVHPLRHRPDPAVQRAERLTQPVRDLGPVIQRLTGQHPHPHPIHLPGRGHLAEHGEVLGAAAGDVEAGGVHRRRPAVPVHPEPPPPRPQPHDHPPVEQHRPPPPQHDQAGRHQDSQRDVGPRADRRPDLPGGDGNGDRGHGDGRADDRPRPAGRSCGSASPRRGRGG